MKILWLGMIDAAGICKIYSNAINQQTEHESRVASVYETRGFDSDLVFERQLWSKPDKLTTEEKSEQLKILADDCDIMIFSAGVMPGVASFKHQVVSDTFGSVWGDVNWHNYIDKKKCFVFFPGSVSLRNNYNYYIDLHKNKNFNMITDQMDIYFDIKEMGHDINYVPLMVNNDKYKNIKIKKSEKTTVVHSPTNRNVKNTAEFMRVCRRLEYEYPDFKMQLIESCGFRQCIDIKRNAHIGFDQMQTEDYFCLASVENSALGLINIVSLTDKAISFIKENIGADSLSWKIARTEEALYGILKKYAKDKSLLLDDRLRSYEWHHKYWDDAKLVHQLTDILEKR